MSASPVTRPPAGTKAIPIRRVLIQDPADLPAHYSATPGGTLYSTTPGGTKIVYERNFLLNLRNSPISKTPPTFDIPGALVKGSPNNSNSNYSTPNHHHNNKNKNSSNKVPKRPTSNSKNSKRDDDDQFEMDL